MLEGKELIIFDCDGVLFDSTDANIAYFNHCLENAGYSSLKGKMRDKIIYMSIRQLIDELIPDPDENKRVLHMTQKIPYEPYLPLLKPLFDFDHVLTQLKKDFYCAVASNRGRSLVKVFKYFNLYNYFHYKISSLDAAAKPDPEMIIRCMDYFNVNTSRALYLGDSISDCNAAFNAGVDYLWVGGDRTPRIESVEDLL